MSFRENVTVIKKSLTNLNYNSPRRMVFYLIFIGCLIGLFMRISPGGLFISAIAIVIGWLIWYCSCRKERKFLLVLFISGMSVRIILFAALYFFISLSGNYYEYFEYRTPAIFGDSGHYTLRAWLMAQHWMDQPISKEVLSKIFDPYGKHGYLYVIAFFYRLFGFSPFSVKFLNVIGGCLCAIFIFFIAKEIFGRKVAKTASTAVMFFPSLLLWSMTNLKETPTILMLTILLWLRIKFQNYKNPFYLLAILILLPMLYAFRSKLFAPIILSLVFSFIVYLKQGPARKVFISSILVFCLLLIISPLGHKLLIQSMDYFNLKAKQIVRLQYGFVGSGGVIYKIYSDRLYKEETEKISSLDFIMGFIKGWVYFLCVPFPWNISTQFQLLASPQVILWYFFIPFIILGIMTGLRHNCKGTLIILIFLFFITSALALVSGNIGTAFRHRDIVTPFYLIFAAAGLIYRIFPNKCTLHINHTEAKQNQEIQRNKK